MTPRPKHAARLLLAALVAAMPIAVRAASFTVVDDKANEELGETTRLYIDGTLVAHFQLDDRVTQKRIHVSVPDRPGHPDHDYTLCGEIAFHAEDGSRRVREVSGHGTLPAPDGHTFLAVGVQDFTLVYLVDPSDRMASRPDPGTSLLCEAPIS